MSIFKNNPRISPKDRNALKGAIRRAFARSALHHQVLNAAIVQHSDPSRPRVKTWARCAQCKQLDAKSYMIVDHIAPVIPTETTFEEFGLDETVNALWCELANMQALCPRCHDAKTDAEKKERKEHKKLAKKTQASKV